MANKDMESVRQLFKKLGGEFKSFVEYDPRLDRITALIRDCSVTEIPHENLLNLYEDNHPGEGQDKLVGFSVDCARVLCRDLTSAIDGQVELDDVLDKVLDLAPNLSNEVAAARRLVNTLVQTRFMITAGRARN